MIRTDDLRQGFQVGPWYVQPLLNRITGPSTTIHLEPRVMRVLICLAERPGDVVTRDELLQWVWGDTIVGEDSLSRTIFDLRKAFDDDPQDPRFIETIRGVGYRLIAPVRYGAGPSAGNSSNSHGDTLPVIARNEAPIVGRGQFGASSYRRWSLIVAGVLFVGVVGFLVSRMTLAPAPPPLRPVPLTSYPGVEFDPALSPDGQHLAFAWQGPDNDNYDLYLKQIGTETPVRFTDHPPPGYDGSPSWSGDGRALAFMRTSEDGCGVYIRPIASSDERKVATCHFHSESSVAWSPDGTWIAFVDRIASDEPFRLYLVSTETLEVQQLTDPPPPYYGDLDPAFSPDGKTLAFVRGAMEGSLARLVSPALGDIYLFSIPDGEARRLTFDNQEIPGLSWTPDGKGIVFTSNRDNGSFDLWVVAVSDGDIRLVLATQSVIRNPSLPLQSPRLVYEDWQRDTNIWRLPLDPASGEDARPERFIASTRAESTPQYSPDGSRIVFTSDRSGYPEIWLCDAQGQQPVQLTRFAGPHTTSPRWSPDGQRIAFVSHAEGHADIYVIHANGGIPRRLTKDPGYDLVPSWSHDGQWIYFGSNRDDTWQVWKTPASGEGEPAQVTREGGFATQESLRAADSLLYYTRVEEHGLWQISLADGEEKQTRLPLWKKDWGNWALREDGIYFLHYQNGAYPVLSRFDLQTSTIDSLTTRLGNVDWTLPGLTVSPDGKWLLYTQPDLVNSDILMVEAYR